MKQKDLERIARRALKETGLYGVPVMIIQLATAYGFDVHEVAEDGLPEGASYIIGQSEGKRVIAVMQNSDTKVERFSIATALSQYLLYARKEEDDFDWSLSDKVCDMDCITLASCILMPPKELRRYVRSWEDEGIYTSSRLSAFALRAASRFLVPAKWVNLRVYQLGLQNRID